MTIATIERTLVDYFEQIGCDVGNATDGSEDWILELLERDDPISLTALAVAINTALSSAKGKSE